MSEINMNEFGMTLTGRPYGKDCAEKLSRRDLKPPFELNFKGVISLGSSFGEEIIVPLANQSPEKLIIKSANGSIKDCLLKIQKDFDLKMEII